MRRALVLLSSLAVASCAPAGDAPTQRASSLDGQVAEIAGQSVSPAEVAAVARAQKVSPARALEIIVAEARLARAADERGLGDRPEAKVERRAALAAAVLRGIKRESESSPPTAEELAEIRRAHWTELDRPEALQVVHVVAQAAPDHPRRADAKAIGEKLLAAVRGATSPDDFRTRASAVPGFGVEITVEAIGPFVKDGRIVSDSDATLDLAFVQASFALEKPQDTSPLVASSFGFHVIMLVERLPPITIPDEQLLPLVTAEVQATRARRAMAAQKQQASEKVEMARNIEDLFQYIVSSPQP